MKNVVMVVLSLLLCSYCQETTAQVGQRAGTPGVAGAGIKAMALPEITASLTATPASYSGPCPTTITFNGKITSPAPGTITYKYLRSDGGIAPEQTLTFPSAGSQAVSTTWHSGEGEGWKQIQVLSPKSVLSNQANVIIQCR